ncbi:AAA family ATPase [Vibrio splendidus]|uniref:AAA family ATPase n=1 Tax=Vibrio splendidus TaxID=29497 RepID=UPI0015E7BB27|nr:AAA family ATPase [Vibrio splendidus]
MASPKPCRSKAKDHLFEALSDIKQDNPYGILVSNRGVSTLRSSSLFSPMAKKLVLDSLIQLFDNKCAYCEQSFVYIDANPEIEHFRPKSGLTDTNTGKHYPLHYIWLSKTWENLYLSCPSCNRAKKNSFPIKGTPCQLLDEGPQLNAELPLLLDPCDTSLSISEHIRFHKNGNVYPITVRGEITIKLLRLNRTSLVYSRKIHAEQVLNLVENNVSIDELAAYMKSSYNQFTELTNQLTSQLERSSNYIEQTSRATDSDIRLYGPKISKITFQNIGPLGGKKHITIGTDTSDSWLMILGDNGSGKSTLLKLITLLLVGREEATSVLESNQIEFVSYLKSGTKAGYISLKFDKGFPDRRLDITENGFTFSSDDKAASIIFNAYGSARLTPTAKHPAAKRNKPFFIDSLFDAFEPLSDAQELLSELTNEERLYAEESLAGLFGLKNKFELVKDEQSNDILFKFASRTFTYQQLSDGFKATVTLFFDIFSTARKLGFEHPADFNGIVLIDELGTHLHPTWRVRIVKELRTLFAQAQFICTTHEPLCIKGLKTGEVVVLKRDGNSPVKLLTNLPPIEGLTSEQLLTSIHFGLNSTLDPEVDSMFFKYYDLIALKEKRLLSEGEKQTLKDLQIQLSKYGALSGVLGGTRRDQLIYHAIDKMIAKNQDKDIAEIIDDETIVKELSSLWCIA